MDKTYYKQEDEAALGYTLAGMFLPLTDGERSILAELSDDAYADALSQWDDLTADEQDALREQARQEAEAADREAVAVPRRA